MPSFTTIKPRNIDTAGDYVVTSISAIGNVSANNISGTVTTQSQPNITSVGTLANLIVSGNANLGNAATANFFIGNGSLLTGLPAGYSNSDVANYLPTYTGNILAGNANLGNAATANFFIGDGSALTNITGANVTGQVANALVASTVYTNAQPNITSTGVLTSLSVTGNITSGNADLGNVSTANFFIGSGNNLSNIQAANVTGAVSFATTANSVAGANVTGEVASATFATTAGTANSVAGANVTGEVAFAATANAVAGANVSGQVANALVAGTVYTNAQPNITSTGILTSLSVTGNTTLGNINAVDAVFTGNLTVQGNTTYVNVDTLVVQDPIIEMGGGANGNALTTNDGKDRGSLLHYYSGAAVDAFMGWDNSNSEFAFGSNVTVSADVVTYNSLGNVRANFFIGDGSLLTGLPASYTDANVAAYLPTYTGNISANNIAVSNSITASSITASSITASGSGGNISGANYVIANFFSGNGSELTSITGANVTGQVANALVSGTVYTAEQPNITSVGTLTSLSVTGNANIGNIATGIISATGNITTLNANLGNAATANFFIGNGSLLTGLPAGYSNADVANYLPTYTGNISANNIAVSNSITASSITASGSGGNISGANYVIANFFSGNGSELTSITGANVTGQVANALVASTVYTNAQPNITSTGILVDLSVTGNAAIGNITTGIISATGNITTLNANLGNAATANFFIGSGNNLSNIQGANVTGAVAFATTANAVAGANVSGQVANALVAGTVYTNAQPNITSVGTLTSLSVSGNLISDNANLGNAATANFFIGNGSLLTGLPAGYSNSDVANYLPTYTGNILAGNANITGNLIVGSTSNLGPISNVVITGGTANYVIATDGTGNLSWVEQPTASNIAGTTDSFTGNGSETTFTLSVTPISENLTFVNIGGVLQLRDSYSLTGSNIVFSAAPINGTLIEITTISGSTMSGSGGSSTGIAIAMSIVFGG